MEDGPLDGKKNNEKQYRQPNGTSHTKKKFKKQVVLVHLSQEVGQ